MNGNRNEYQRGYCFLHCHFTGFIIHLPKSWQEHSIMHESARKEILMSGFDKAKGDPKTRKVITTNNSLRETTLIG